MNADVLIVDDEVDIRDLVAGILDDEGYRTRTAGSAQDALNAVEARRPHLIFLDIWLQGSRMDGLQVLDIVKQQHPELPVVMISGHGNIETAVSAIKRGAYDFIEKPFKADRLVLVAERALEASRLRREVRELKTMSVQASRIIGTSQATNQLRQQLDRVGPTNARVLITGAPGAGKELAARTLHAMSTRSTGSFVILNAAAMAPDTMEAELFGVEGGAGRTRKIGALEEAHGGSLYIDEIADMPRETQSKILRVLTDQNFQRLGGATRVHVDVRIVSSTSRDLKAEIAEGRLREDLFHRLSVVPIRIPTLAERREDIPELIEYFMEQISISTGLARRRMAADARAVLQSHDWPGNVRQLRNNIERVMILAAGDAETEVTADMLPSDVGALVPGTPSGAGGEKLMGLPLRDAREIFEREYLVAQLNRFGGNISRTAEFVGMERSALHRKLKSLGIERVMSRIAYVNGRYVKHRDARVHIEDRGYQFADGVYEVCEVRGGRMIDLTRHLDRLERSLGELRIAMPVSRQVLPVILREVVAQNRVGEGTVYLQATRGVARRDHAFPTFPVRPSLIVTARANDTDAMEALAGKGIDVVTVPENRWGRVDIKSVALLPNVLAKQQAREVGAREAWFVDAHGLVTEGASSNAWIVLRGGKIVTRAADRAILKGVTRATLFDLLRGEGYAVEERAFSVNEAKDAMEAFITSASSIVTPVVRIDGQSVGNGAPGTIATALRARFHSFAESA